MPWLSREQHLAQLVQISAAYQTRGDFGAADRCAYQRAVYHGLLDEVCAHMDAPRTTTRTPDSELINDARTYPNRQALRRANRPLYSALCQRKLLDTAIPKTPDITVNGRLFTTDKEVLSHYGIGSTALSRYKARGSTTEQAVNQILQNKAYKEVEVFGVSYKLADMPFLLGVNIDGGSTRRAAAALGITLGQYAERLIESRKVKQNSVPYDKSRSKHKQRAVRYGTDYEPGITAAAVALRDGFQCQLCGTVVEQHLGQGWQPSGWSVGHIQAMSRGGHHTWDNVQCECMECNLRKGTRTVGSQLGC